MNYVDAVEATKEGAKVRRESWKNDDFIFYVPHHPDLEPAPYEDQEELVYKAFVALRSNGISDQFLTTEEDRAATDYVVVE